MDRNPALAATGVLAAAVSLASVLLATMVSPSFEWAGNALSNLGVAGTDVGTPTTALLFNGGLIVGALLGLVFAYFLWIEAGSRGKRAVAGLLALTLLVMGLLGVFPQGTAPHVPLSVAFFVLITVTIWADAVAVRNTDEGRRGAIAAWLGATNVAAWGIWVATGPLQRPGLAIPEIVGSLALGAWLLSTAIRLSQWEPAVSRSPAS